MSRRSAVHRARRHMPRASRGRTTPQYRRDRRSRAGGRTAGRGVGSEWSARTGQSRAVRRANRRVDTARSSGAPSRIHRGPASTSSRPSGPPSKSTRTDNRNRRVRSGDQRMVFGARAKRSRAGGNPQGLIGGRRATGRRVVQNRPSRASRIVAPERLRDGGTSQLNGSRSRRGVRRGVRSAPSAQHVRGNVRSAPVRRAPSRNTSRRGARRGRR